MQQLAAVIDLSDERVLSIPVRECGEPMVDVADRGILFGEPPEYPDTAPHYRLLREGVLARLERAQAALPQGLRLRVYEGYRSPVVQARIFAAQLARTTHKNPTWTDEQCYREAARLASPLCTFDGSTVLPPHSTGGAVDVEIVEQTGKVIDFGMEIKDWTEVAPELCATGFAGISASARRSRELLVRVLQASGFVNYPREWWHFSYGDRYWALINGQPNAIYGGVER